MTDLITIAKLRYPDGVPGMPDSPVSVMLHYHGHYRLDRFDQTSLEDLRQRLCRRGISLWDFREQCLPALFDLLYMGVELGELKQIPRLFSYQMPPVYVEEYASKWLENVQESSSEETFKRYRSILNRNLLPRFQGFDLCRLDGDTLSQYQEEYLLAGGGKKGFEFHSRILYSILDLAVAEEIRQEGPDAFPARREKEHPVFFSAVAQQWFQTLAPNQQQKWKKPLDTMIQLLGHADLAKLGEEKAYWYRRLLARNGMGSEIFSQHMALLKKIRTYARAQDLIQRRKSLNSDRQSRVEAKRLPGAREREIILQDHPEEPDMLILRLALQMGLRNEEIRMFQWDDIHWDEGWAEIDGRNVPIPADLADTLHRLAVENGGHGYVILTARKKLSPISMSYLIIAAQKSFRRYGMEHIRLNDLRNDYVIRLLQSMSPEEAAKQSGFDDMKEFTARYVDFLAER